MVRAYTPQRATGTITVNTNYPPQKFDEAAGGQPSSFNDLSYVNGGDRGNTSYVVSGDRGKVDYEDVI